MDWLVQRKHGGHFLDQALAGIQTGFGPERLVGAIAPLDATENVSGFFFQVRGSVADDEDWAMLLAAHEVMLDWSRGFRVSPAARYDTFHLILDEDPAEPVMLSEALDRWLGR